jgi:hypothetical protein
MSSKELAFALPMGITNNSFALLSVIDGKLIIQQQVCLKKRYNAMFKKFK